MKLKTTLILLVFRIIIPISIIAVNVIKPAEKPVKDQRKINTNPKVTEKHCFNS